MKIRPLKPLFSFFYFSLYIVAIIIAALVSAKMRRYWAQRIYRPRFSKISPPTYERPIWIHAASGEFEYARSVLKVLKKRGHATLVTFFSPTYSSSVLKNPWVDAAEPLPLDLPGPMNSFLIRHRPRALWIARTDLWPELLDQCQAHGIPVLVFSASRSISTSGFSQDVAKLSVRFLWNQLSQVYCVDDKDRQEFQRLGLHVPIEALGDTRYDQAIDRVSERKTLPLLESALPLPILVAGSTWPEDEEVILPEVLTFITQQRLRLILVPHEPSESALSRIEGFFSKHSVTVDRYSKSSNWKAPVLLVDQVGLLADIYSYGHLAFVGGSYRSKVHSVMEPLASGLPTLIGPRSTNNREAQEFALFHLEGGQPAVMICSDGPAFRAQLGRILDLGQWKTWREQMRSEVSKRQGASERLVEHMKNLLKNESQPSHS